MALFKLKKALLVLIGTVVLNGCSYSSSYNFKGILLTDIKSDGTKLFIFTSPQGQIGSNELRRADIPRNGQRASANRGPSRADYRDSLEKGIFDALDRKLLESGYCREGYLRLGSFIERGIVEIKGECQESATADDREKFAS